MVNYNPVFLSQVNRKYTIAVRYVKLNLIHTSETSKGVLLEKYPSKISWENTPRTRAAHSPNTPHDGAGGAGWSLSNIFGGGYSQVGKNEGEGSEMSKEMKGGLSPGSARGYFGSGAGDQRGLGLAAGTSDSPYYE
jgi:hypothetical protein